MEDESNTAYLSEELRKHEVFTKADIRSNWVDTKFIPGLYARNRYGREILKHFQSWRKVLVTMSLAALSLAKILCITLVCIIFQVTAIFLLW